MKEVQVVTMRFFLLNYDNRKSTRNPANIAVIKNKHLLLQMDFIITKSLNKKI